MHPGELVFTPLQGAFRTIDPWPDASRALHLKCSSALDGTSHRFSSRWVLGAKRCIAVATCCNNPLTIRWRSCGVLSATRAVLRRDVPQRVLLRSPPVGGDSCAKRGLRPHRGHGFLPVILRAKLALCAALIECPRLCRVPCTDACYLDDLGPRVGRLW